MLAPINAWSILAAAIASMVIGSIWFGPLFGKLFMHEKGMDTWSKEKQAEMKKSMGLSYFGQFIASLVMFYVLARIIVGFGKTTLLGGMLSGFVLWIGFVVPLALGEAIWGGKRSLFLLSIGNMFVTLLVAGGIIGFWN